MPRFATCAPLVGTSRLSLTRWTWPTSNRTLTRSVSTIPVGLCGRKRFQFETNPLPNSRIESAISGCGLADQEVLRGFAVIRYGAAPPSPLHDALPDRLHRHALRAQEVDRAIDLRLAAREQNGHDA